MSASDKNSTLDSITFFLNDEKVCVKNIAPSQSVLNYLREHQLTKGTKEGCAEGDCGACTVVIAELSNSKVKLKNVNACIQFMPTLDGKALYTVEYLRNDDGSLHPVQQAMVDYHGSQCGFCTPGFVMSLWSVYVANQQAETRPTDKQLRSALTGNLCRCTGYRPILEAAKEMFNTPSIGFDIEGLKNKLLDIQRKKTFSYCHLNQHFFAPKNLEQLTALRAEKTTGIILSGGTDIGIWVNKQFRELKEIIYVGEVDELKHIKTTNDNLRIGAAVSLSDAANAINHHYPEMTTMWERFASQPIRNVGTLGGNVANGSPIGDSMPALIALNSRVVLTKSGASRVILMQDFYLDYMKKDLAADEVLESVLIPLPHADIQFRCYKLSKRYDSDISAVFAAFAITLNNNIVETIKIVYGGMASIPKCAFNTEGQLKHQLWDEATVKKAMSCLATDYCPMTDMRASDKNRMQSAQNLLYRFFLETRSDNPLSPESVDVFNARSEVV